MNVHIEMVLLHYSELSKMLEKKGKQLSTK